MKAQNLTNKLYPLDIAIYNRIKYFEKEKSGFCFETNASFSLKLNRTPQRISSSINKLLKLGYIKNEGSKWCRQLKTTEKTPEYTFLNFNKTDNTLNKTDNSFNKNDITINKTDISVLKELLKDFNKNDISILTKAIRVFNKSDNIIIDNKRYELIDIVKDIVHKESKESLEVEVMDEVKEVVHKLKDILEENYQREFNPKCWYEQIRLMNTYDKISFENMLGALEWYKQNITDKYIPVIQSGKSFREKFVKIQEHYKRNYQNINIYEKEQDDDFPF